MTQSYDLTCIFILSSILRINENRRFDYNNFLILNMPLEKGVYLNIVLVSHTKYMVCVLK